MAERWGELGASARRRRSAPVRSRSHVGRRYDAVLWMPLLIGAALAWAPFLYGGNDGVAWGVNAILFGALVCLGAALSWRDGVAIPLRAVRGPAALFAAAAVWAALQALPHAPDLLVNPAWEVASGALGRHVGGSISVDPLATQLGLVRLLTAASVFWICLQAAADARGAKTLLFCLALTTAIYALYGLIAFGIVQGQAPTADLPSARAEVTATFVNRNHYATYAGLGVILWLSLWTRALGAMAAVQAPWRYRLVKILETTFGRNLPYLAGAIVCAVALLLTGSRAGVIATCIGVVALVIAQGRNRRGLLAVAPGLVVLAGFAVVLLFVFGDVMGEQLSRKGLGDPGRVAAYVSEVHAVQARPLLGWGYASFADVFPQFRSSDVGVWGVWDRAHNTYMDLVIGLGLVAGSALVISVVWLGVICWLGAGRRDKTGFSAQAVGALVLVGAHALVDFSMEIQGITLTLTAILAAGTAQSLPKREMVDLGQTGSRLATPAVNE